MNNFDIDSDLEIGNVFEVSGNAIKIALLKSITELTKSYNGKVYSVGQLGSIIKLHMGRRIIFATVKLLRLQTDEESALISESMESRSASDHDKRVLEADLLGEGFANKTTRSLKFRRGVTTYPLPLQAVHLTTQLELEALYESVESSRDDDTDAHAAIGTYVGATKVQCRADIDKLFGQHCAVLGSTGSGKSGTVAAIIHAVLEHQAREDRITRPSIILIDPHGEYGAAFPMQSTKYVAYDSLGNDDDGTQRIELPYWLMSSDEFRSLVVGKTEFEATSQANTVYKALAHARMVEAGLIRSALEPIPIDLPDGQHAEEPVALDDVSEEQIISFDRDKPRPFKLAEFRAHIENRQAVRKQGNNWNPVTPSDFQKEFASILNKFRVLSSDQRIQFLMAEYTDESQDLTQILSQFLDVEGNDSEPLKIIDISGLPNEVAGPLTGAIARLLFQYKLHQTREQRENDPVLFVCEEAHRYVPNSGSAQYEVAQSAIRRLAREGRKYGLGLMLVSQRPADVEGTVISQCNSWIVLRLSNSSDQQHVSKFLPDNLSGMTSLLSSLPRQEALFVGEAAALPARIKLNTLRSDQLPNSNDVSFASGWASERTTSETLEEIVTRMSGS